MRGSSEYDEEDGAGCDPSIYIRVLVDKGLNEWFALKKNQTTLNNGKYIHPALPAEPHRYFSGCVAVGSTIYVFGGEDPAYTQYLIPPCVRDVFYIDSLCPEMGWKKLPYSLNKPRAFPYGLHIDGKIYVFGGHRDLRDPDMISTIEPEVFDTTSYKDEDNDKKEGWRLVGDSVDAPVIVNGHALLDGGKRIIVFGCVNPRLFLTMLVPIHGRYTITSSEDSADLPLLMGFCISWTEHSRRSFLPSISQSRTAR